jgi:HSP20 family protein
MALRNLVPWHRKGVAGRSEPVVGLRREMDDLLERFFGGENVGWPAEALAPDMDVTETDGEIRVSTELPGVEEKDIDISLANGVLRIRGEKKAEKEEKDEGRRYVERSYGVFERSLQLPGEVDADRAAAKLEKGVLTVTLPKTAKAAGTKKISVST